MERAARGKSSAFCRFEDLPVWKDARQLTKIVYNLTGKGTFRKDFGLRDQIQRAAVSVMSNLAEGFERKTRREFAHFLIYAKGSTGELRCQLYIALDLQYISLVEFKAAHDLAVSISQQLANFIKYLSNSQDRPSPL
jgi:four helix bundle protein